MTFVDARLNHANTHGQDYCSINGGILNPSLRWRVPLLVKDMAIEGRWSRNDGRKEKSERSFG